ncbi:DUF6985 domain-containing protein [Dokdonella sp. MW10]|uniref:DUF6985 domain-containing protein n=1 Tax=Dokdonella sp. MW10 TaxID=2992926 RepID=UPI003F7DD7C5
MDISLGDATLSFRFDDDLNQTVCRFRLETWEGFSSENTRDGCDGANVILVLESESDEADPELGSRERYESALLWLVEHQAEARDVVLRGILGHIVVMRTEYGIDDEELNEIESVEQLTANVDLSFVRIFPHSKAGLPYLGFELECDWDPEHGCGVLVCGTDLVDAGTSDSAQSIGAIEEHGGAV